MGELMIKKPYVRRARYEFIGRQEQNWFGQMKVEHLLNNLEQGNVRGFNNVIGIIQDYVDVYPDAPISEDWQKILKLPYILFNAAIGRSEKDAPPINNTIPKSTIKQFERL
jgi:hypothetical protein